MSTSYFEQLGRASTAPPDISKTNYLETEADMSKAVNESIDQTAKWNDEHANQLIAQYNHMHDQQMKRPQELVNLLEQGKKTFDEYQKWDAYWDKYYKYALPLAEQQARIRENPDAVIQPGQLGDFDNEVQAENELQGPSVEVSSEGGMVAAGSEANPDISGPARSWGLEPDLYKDLDDLKTIAYPTYLPLAQEGMKVHIGYTTDDGKPIFQSYNETTSIADKSKILTILNAWFAYKHEDLVNGRFGLYKKEFINHIELQSSKEIKDALENHVAAEKELYVEKAGEELAVRIKSNPSFFIDWLHIHKGRFNGDLRRTRNWAFDTLGMHVDNGTLKRHHIEPIMEHKFQANGDPEGKLTDAKTLWPKQYRELMAKVGKEESAEAQAEEDNRKGERDADVEDILSTVEERDTPLEYQQRQKLILEFMSRHGISDPRLLPDKLKTIPYAGLKDDLTLDQLLTHKVYTLNQSLSPADLIGFTDPNLKKKWLEIAKSGVGMSQTDITRRNNVVTAAVVALTKETDVNTSKTPKYWNNYYQAIDAYNEIYNNYMATVPNATPNGAHKAAKEFIESDKGLYRKILSKNDLGQPIEINQWDVLATSSKESDLINGRTDAQTIASIGKDPTLINSKNPWNGEKPHLAAAANYVAKSSAGKPISLPEYYRRMGRLLGINPEVLMRNRLEATGALKEGEWTFPWETELSTEDQQKLVKPTASKVYQITQDNEDITWMLDSSKSKAAIDNGGYTAIKNPSGKYVNIEEVTGKKLSEITAGDVYSLVLDGYTNLGVYDIRPQGFVDLIESGLIPLDAAWDIKDQDRLYLQRLRLKSQQSQRYTGINLQYRRLVNIPEADKEKFKKIAGDLPTWLQLDTLLPEAAKALVEETIK